MFSIHRKDTEGEHKTKRKGHFNIPLWSSWAYSGSSGGARIKLDYDMNNNSLNELWFHEERCDNLKWSYHNLSVMSINCF